jgi:hypothetical protein
MAFRLHFFAFMLSFAAGILMCYLMSPPMTVVHRFPSPYNCNGTVYSGRFGDCYKYTATKVDCKSKELITRRQPSVPH